MLPTTTEVPDKSILIQSRLDRKMQFEKWAVIRNTQSVWFLLKYRRPLFYA